ncbi:unnamed protein product, partial [Mesorhabditis belari]|uniref:Osteoclast-stimulating factor 1 n=1 Tax=Mesorhabditis belari TaxID=2138241 RepID=A0AAF3ECK9_9BILA
MATAPPPRPPRPGRIRVFRALYDYTARSTQEMSFSEGDIIYVSEEGPNADWLSASCGGKKGLVPANYVVSEQVEHLQNPLHEAAKRGNIEFLKECLQNEVSINSLDKSGSTALYWACHGGHVEMTSYLLQNTKINILAKNKIGDTALHAAAWRGHPDCVRLLLERDADVWTKNENGKTASEVAKDPETAALLSAKMRSDRCNEDEINEYASESDND